VIPGRPSVCGRAIKVPLFIHVGDHVKADTVDHKYQARVGEAMNWPTFRYARERYCAGAGLGVASPGRSPMDHRTMSSHIFWMSGRSQTS